MSEYGKQHTDGSRSGGQRPMTDTPELNVWREACFAYGGASIEGAELEPSAAAVIRDYGDKRDADAYQRGKLEGARLAIEAAAKDAEEWFPSDTSKRYLSFGVIASIRALDPAKIVADRTDLA